VGKVVTKFSGLLLILALGLVTYYTGYLVGEYKRKNPRCCSFADAGYLIAGRAGKEIMAVSMNLILLFIMSAHILSFTIALDVLTDNGTCSIVWGIVAAALSFIFGLPRTMKKLSWISIFCEYFYQGFWSVKLTMDSNNFHMCSGSSCCS
jgi:hypothetical protein